MESDTATDIVRDIETHLARNQASEPERTLMLRAATEINLLRNRGDSPLLIRNSDLAMENRKLREENRWLRVFESLRATEQAK